MKVLLSAYACEPYRGSEPGVGWNTACEVAKYHEVWVLTSNTHRDPIEAELLSNPIPNLHFVYLDPMGWVYDWTNEEKRTHWGIHLHYYLWQIQAYLVARQLHQEIGVNVIHHVTYVKYSSPSFLALLPVPFVWGPVAGGELAPTTFWQDFSLRGKVYEALRTIASHVGELDPFVHITAKRSSVAHATTEDTAKRLRKIGATNVKVLSQVGLSTQEIDELEQQTTQQTQQTRFISIGRLLHWKGFHLGLQAFAQADLPPDADYWIVGGGAEFDRLQALSQQLKIEHRVKFWGKQSRQETLNLLRQCSVLVHPSLHESGGFVCVEAMAVGCPVICLDIGGPALQVTEATGFKVPAHHPDQAVQGIAEAMTCLAHNLELRTRLGEAGQQRAKEFFTWEAKGQMISQLYQNIVCA